jgi:two-component system phosphate regulon response regulator PhoB
MTQSRRHVLVVEDDPEINELVGAYAQIAGFGYEAALNGFTALSKALAEAPVLILLDVMLPDMDGFEVCRRLKRDHLTCTIPVVMLTALDREEYRRRGQECGAAAFLGKPFDPDALIEMIRKMASDGANLQPSQT